ncbi:hypothetical protein LXL04_030899 [Taraxacum kok-saghyz]
MGQIGKSKKIDLKGGDDLESPVNPSRVMEVQRCDRGVEEKVSAEVCFLRSLLPDFRSSASCIADRLLQPIAPSDFRLAPKSASFVLCFLISGRLLLASRPSDFAPSDFAPSDFRMATSEGVIDVDDQNDDGVEVTEEEIKSKLKSVVWEHFPYKKGAKKSKCKYCKKLLAPSGVDWDVARNMNEYLNYLLYIAVVLDPRNKLTYVSYCIELIHGKGSEKSKEIVGNVTKTLDELFNHYKGKVENTNVPNPQDSIFGEKSSISEMNIDLELEFDKLDDGVQEIKSEVEIYLADIREKRDQKFDLLGWWKTNSIKFSILSKLARHVLAMPISTVASESTFSTGGRVIDKYRSSLNPETAEALICAQDWIRSTKVDLELGCGMKNKEIDEFNEKFAGVNIGNVFYFSPYILVHISNTY